MHVDTLCERDFEHIAVLRDPPAGLLAFVVVHDTRRGPAFGGIRCKPYDTPSDALADGLRLAAAMTRKCAISDVPGGGGKTVLVESAALDRVAAYRAIGRAVRELGGRYYTGPDVGTTADDLAEVARETEFVARPDAACGDLAVPTALAVFAGIGAVATRLGFDDLDGLKVAIQGAGAVGGRLAERLAAAGAYVTLADVREDAARALAERIGARTVRADEILAVPCDVLAPCALGAVIDAQSIDTLRARAIAGSANNVLADDSLADELARRGILYAPDFVIGSGALIHGAWFHLEGAPPPTTRILAVGDRIGEILDAAAREHVSTLAIARRIADDKLHLDT